MAEVEEVVKEKRESESERGAKKKRRQGLRVSSESV